MSSATVTSSRSFPPDARENTPETSSSFLGALLTGELAAVLMGATYVCIFVALGHDALFPFRVIGSAIFGDSALHRLNGTAAFAGVMLHLTVATLPWVVVFYFVAKLSRARSFLHFLLLGVGVGVASELLDAYLLVPPFMRALHGHDIYSEHITKPISWIGHMVFGVCYAFAPFIERWRIRVAHRMYAH